MKVIILAQKDSYALRRLANAITLRQHHLKIISPIDCTVRIDGAHAEVIYYSQPLSADVVLLRCIAYTRHGITIVRAFETYVANQLKLSGAVCINDPEAKLRAHDKFLTLQALNNSGIPVPPTFLTWNQTNLESIAYNHLGFPLILKMNEGTWGMGVTRADSLESARSIFDTIKGMERVFTLQKYVAEAKGRDIRVFVLGKRVIGAIKRTARVHDFRSNIHQGGRAESVHLPSSYADVAIRAADVMGLDIAGVDILETNEGPKVIEVNPSPGFESIESATGVDVATQIVQYIEQRVKN